MKTVGEAIDAGYIQLWIYEDGPPHLRGKVWHELTKYEGGRDLLEIVAKAHATVGTTKVGASIVKPRYPGAIEGELVETMLTGDRR